MSSRDDDTPRLRPVAPPRQRLEDQDHAIGRLSAEVSRCTLAIESLKKADDEMHELMGPLVKYVERAKGRDLVLGALGLVFLTSIGTMAVMTVRNDSAIDEARNERVVMRGEANETAGEVRQISREMAKLNENLARWQATTEQRVHQADERSRRNDDAIRALERGGQPALRRQLRERDQEGNDR